MKGFHCPSPRTTNSVRLILSTQYSLCENYIKRARLHWGLKQVLGTNLIPLRTKFDTQTKRVPAWPVINQLWSPGRHFSANGISLRLGEVQIKICKGSLQALLSSAPRAFAACSRILARPVSLAQTGEIAHRLTKSKSQDCWVTFKPKNYLEILLSAYARTSQANILHLDQKAMKCMTCKWLCGK